MANLQKNPNYLRKETAPDGSVEVFRWAYGFKFDENYTDLQIELEMMLKYEYGALKGGEEKGKQHIKRAMCLVSPKFEKGWNPWNDLMLDLYTKDDPEKLFRTIWGPGHCGKSHFSGLFLYVWWLSDPFNKGVLLYCAKITDAMSRIFTYILEIHKSLSKADFFDFDVDHSKNANTQYKAIGLFPVPKEDSDDEDLSNRGGIKLMALKDEYGTYGENTLGWHPPKGFRSGGDEQQECKDMLMYASKAVANWSSNINAKHIGWGNPSPEQVASFNDLLNYLGEYDEKDPPNPNLTSSWENDYGYVLHLSHLDNPLDDPQYAHLIDVDSMGAKKHRWDFLRGKAFAKIVERNAKKAGGADSPAYWSQIRGFPRPNQGLTDNKVLSWDDVLRYGADQPADFDRSKPIIWVFGSDTSLSSKGTECLIFGAELGFLKNGMMAVDLHNGKHVYLVDYSQKGKEPEEYRARVKFVQQKYKVGPERFFIEVWGPTHVLGHDLNKYWSDQWHEIRPTGKVSLRQTTPDSRLPAKKEYGSCMTEHHFGVKGLTMTGQIKGFPQIVAEQYENREVVLSDKTGLKLLKEKTSNEKHKRSDRKFMNDWMDAVAILIEGCRRHHFLEMDGTEMTIKDDTTSETPQETSQPQVSREEFMYDINSYLGSL